MSDGMLKRGLDSSAIDLPCSLPEGDLALLESLADFAAIAINNCRKRSVEVQRANRAESFILDEFSDVTYTHYDVNPIIQTQIHRCLRHNCQCSWIAIELEGLKGLTESVSYRMFDGLVTQIAGELSVLCQSRTPDLARTDEPPSDLVFRCRDQFYVFLVGRTKEEASRIALQVHRFFEENVWLKEDGVNVHLPARIAVATYPVDSESGLGILNCLQESLQLVEQSGHNGVAAANVGILEPL